MNQNSGQKPAENPWKKRAHTAANLLAWIVMIVVAVFFFLRMQEDRETRERIRREPKLQVCMDHLAQIGIALRQYAEKHKGAYPETLDQLVKEKYLLDPESLKCPESGSEYLYLYEKGMPLPCSASMPLVIDKLNNHTGRINVLYADSQVRNEPILKKRYTRIALRKSSCTKKEQRYLKKRLREYNRIFFVKEE